jgi:hypothetical protein
MEKSERKKERMEIYFISVVFKGFCCQIELRGEQNISN